MLSTLSCILFGCAIASTSAIFYRCANQSTDHYTDIPSGNQAAFVKGINTSLQTIFYIHGWRESCGNLSALTTTSALLSRGNSNVCCLDWSEYTKLNYVAAAAKTHDVAKIFSDDIIGFYGLGLRVGDPYLIGFSLGAQVAGFTGKNLKGSKPSYELGRITGLDAALPLFIPPLCVDCRHLESTDAKFVDCIHTDGGMYGALEPIGSCDIYANGGKRFQVGCPILPNANSYANIKPQYRCSHDRAWIYFSEAVRTRGSHIAVKCDSLSSLNAGTCSKNAKVSLGLETNSTCQGTYQYKTRSESPFGEGEEGTSS